MSRRHLSTAFVLLSMSIVASSCSGNSEEARLTGTPVDGYAAFGTQCPFGTIARPKATRLQLLECPAGLDRLELSEPLKPLFLQVDCKKKTISVRTDDRRLDTLWEVMPNGSFSLSFEGPLAKIVDDGSGTKNCEAMLSTELSGTIDCTDQDRAIIHFEALAWTSKASGTCKLPSTCYLYAKTSIQQCI